MQPLYTEEQYANSRNEDTLPCRCYTCQKTFLTTKKRIKQELKVQRGRVKYCSQICHQIVNHPKKKQLVKCKQCDTEFLKKSNQVKKSPNHFCSKHCSGTYNNTHKTHGTRRSKLEVWLEQQLPALYPSLEFNFNHKDAINSELDIYIPSLKLAFELNGLFHYEPIFGVEKLAQIQNNDERKFQACIERGIELCLIDVSSFKNFKPLKAMKYLSIINDLITKKLSS